MSLDTAIVSNLAADLARLQPVIDRYELWALFVACLVEGFGVPVPGQTLLIACALLAASGKLDIVSVLALAWLATQLGDILGYAIGCHGLRRMLAGRAKKRLRAFGGRLLGQWDLLERVVEPFVLN